MAPPIAPSPGSSSFPAAPPPGDEGAPDEQHDGGQDPEGPEDEAEDGRDDHVRRAGRYRGHPVGPVAGLLSIGRLLAVLISVRRRSAVLRLAVLRLPVAGLLAVLRLLSVAGLLPVLRLAVPGPVLGLLPVLRLLPVLGLLAVAGLLLPVRRLLLAVGIGRRRVGLSCPSALTEGLVGRAGMGGLAHRVLRGLVRSRARCGQDVRAAVGAQGGATPVGAVSSHWVGSLG